MSYGDIRKITSRAPAASTQMASDDAPYMNKYKSSITSVGRKSGMDPAVIAGIISRESSGGRGLDSQGCGDHGHAFGLMQVDKRWHEPQGGPYSEEHISQCTKILTDWYNAVRSQPKRSRWTREECLQGALAAYNMGDKTLESSFDRVDEETTGKDYSIDVIFRAKFFKANGY